MAQYSVVKMTPDLVPGCVEALRDSFFAEEKVSCAVGLLEDSPIVKTDSPHKCTMGSLELESLCLDVVHDDISVVAIDKKTNEVLGAAFNKIQVLPPPGELSYFEKFGEEKVKDPSAKALMDFMINVDSRLNLFDHFKATCGLELMFLVVKNSAKGQGIGQALIEETIKIGDKYDKSPKPSFVCAIFSSNFSQKAGSRAGMETLLKLPYSEFEYKGRKYSEIIGPEHPDFALCAKKLPLDLIQ